MTVSTRFTFGRLMALMALGLPMGFLASVTATNFSGSLWVTVGAVAVVAAALWTCNRLANRAAVRLESTRLPWALWGAFTAAFWVGAIALMEIGALFAANDLGFSAEAIVPVMVATGIVGAASAVATFVIVGFLVVRLVQPGKLGIAR